MTDRHPAPPVRPIDCLDRYLSEPCDQEGCESTATHNGIQRGTAGMVRGRWCNAHTAWDHPAFARND